MLDKNCLSLFPKCIYLFVAILILKNGLANGYFVIFGRMKVNISKYFIPNRMRSFDIHYFIYFIYFYLVIYNNIIVFN